MDAPAQLDDIATQLLVGSDLHDEPFEANLLVGIDGSAEPDPELEAQHRAALREVRARQRQQQSRSVRAAGGRPTKPRCGGELGVMVDRIVLARCGRKFGHEGL